MRFIEMNRNYQFKPNKKIGCLLGECMTLQNAEYVEIKID
jgi:hypothetical protein